MNPNPMLTSIAKAVIQSLGVNPKELTRLDKSIIYTRLSRSITDEHIVEIVAETAARHPDIARSAISSMFASFPGGLSPSEAAVYDSVAKQLAGIKDAAISQLLETDKEPDEAELRDAEERHRDLKKEDYQYRNSRQ